MTGAEQRSADEILAATVARITDMDGEAAGAGALVAPDLVLTCAHVVSDALGLPRHEPVPGGTEVTIEFPLAGRPAGRPGLPRRTGLVEHWIPTRADRTGDLAVLRLREAVPGVRPLPMADPGSVWEHGARAVGFTGGEPGEIWFRGKLSGSTSEGWVQLSRADGQTAHIVRGFSGSPVWDNDLEAAVGLVVAAQSEREGRQAFVLRTGTLIAELPQLADVVLPPTPFRGLATFQEGDADVFFGRDGDIEDVVRALHGDRPAVTLYGPSGSGKSSLALAGVVPRMRQAGYEVLVIDAGRVASPRSALATELYEAVRTGRYGSPPRATDADTIEKWFAAKGLADTFHRVRGTASGRLLVVLDQAEALLDRTEAEVAQAVDLLFPERPPAGVRVLATLRADFVDTVLRHPRLGPALLGGSPLPLTPMTREQLTEVVVEPLKRIPAVAYDPGLDRRILDDAGGDPGVLPLLGFVLEQLWEQRAGGRLRAAAYEEMEGVTGALELHAERAWRECVGDRQDVEDEALRLLTGLVRVLPGSETPLRRRLTRAEAGETRWRIARSFADRRLLVLHGGETEPETAELAHEALITAWPALRRQVKADGAFLAGRAELAHDRERWERAGRSPDLLPGRSQLAAAERWSAGREEELTGEERSFLALARRRHRTRRARLRAAWTAVAGVFALIVGLGTFLIQQADVNRQREAESRSRALASLSEEMAARDPGQAALAAVAAYDVAPTQEARSALLRSYDRFKDAGWVLTGTEGEIDALAMSADGSVTLVTSEEGRATLFLRDGGEVRRLPLRLPAKAGAPMVSANGRRIAYVADGQVTWRDVDPRAKDDEAVLGRADTIRGPALEVPDSMFSASVGLAAISPDGTRVAALHVAEKRKGQLDDQRLWVWDLVKRERREVPVAGPLVVERVWYGPDADTVVAQRRRTSDDRTSRMDAIDTRTGRTRVLAAGVSMDDGAAQLGMSADGTTLAVCRRGATISSAGYRLIRVADGRQLHRHDVETGCHTIAISATGEQYAVRGLGEWHMVDRRPGHKVKPFIGPGTTLLSDLPLVGDPGAPTMVIWDETAVTGYPLALGPLSNVDSHPVLLARGTRALVHLGEDGERLAVIDTSEGLGDERTGELKILASVKRDMATAPEETRDLFVNRAETLVADLVGRDRVAVREVPSLRLVSEITTAMPPLDGSGKPKEPVEFMFPAENELVTVSGTRIEHWNARTGKRLSEPFDVAGLGLNRKKSTRFFLGGHPEPGHVRILVDGDPTLYAVALRTGRENRELRLTLGSDVVNAVPDASGRYAAAKTKGDMLELWSVPPPGKGEPERLVGPVGPLKSGQYQAGFVADSSDFFLAAGTSVRFLRLTDLRRSESYDFAEEQHFLSTAKDGRTLLRYQRDGSVDMLRLDPALWKKHVCEVMGRDLGEDERRGVYQGLPPRICPA
ncbi:trypsin-like peptidase domain-containing protein [Streptomyces lavendulocolor]|uniref:nSTAND1 domain-containing NTPase n=1 Tax=Streptomyces lavendulocolor TaxID=67316 RepID=UPI003C2E975E